MISFLVEQDTSPTTKVEEWLQLLDSSSPGISFKKTLNVPWQGNEIGGAGKALLPFGSAATLMPGVQVPLLRV